jgi:glycerophosphoryl diester phosphodiesterase
MPTEPRSRPLLLGHRGCRLRGFHENFHSAFAHALASGCDGFEFDVRLTSDQRPICLHDSAIGHMEISSYTYEQLSKEYFKDAHRSASGVLPTSQEAIPCLPDVLESYTRSAFLNIELKVAGLERFALQLLRKHLPKKGYVISSFIPEVICEIAELAPSELGQEAQLGFLFDGVSGLQTWPNMPGPWVVPRHDLVTKELVKSVHAAGRKILCWTVNRPADMLRLTEWGVDALISDDPVLLCDTIAGRD